MYPPRIERQYGSPDFLAPEMVQKKDHSYSLDLWGLGIIMYEMLTDELPFVGSGATGEERRADTKRRIISDEVKFKWKHFVSSSVQDLITSLMQKNPEDRLSLSGVLSHEWIRKHTDDEYRSSLSIC